MKRGVLTLRNASNGAICGALLFLLCLISIRATAQTLDAPIDPASLGPGDLVSMVEADLNDDGRPDIARLVVGAHIDADLKIWLGTTSSPSVVVEGIAWRGALYGTQPELTLGPQGSLMLKTQNTAIGRWKWTETLTIAYREGRFLIAGYTYSGYDGIDLTTLDCDVNLLTGNGYHNGEIVLFAPRRIGLTEWSSERDAPSACQR